jgi:hypothetical protein
MRAKNLVSVKFIRKNSPYNVGEIAGFPPDIAEKLVKRKRAVYSKPDKEAPPKPPPAKEDAVEPPKPKAKAKAKPKAKAKKK